MSRTSRTHGRHLATRAALLPALLGVLVAGCWTSSGSGSPRSASAVAGAGGSAGSASVSMVSCSGNTCSVTLAGTGSSVHVLGTTISLEQLRDGRATLGVGGRTVACTQGHSVRAGRLRLTCTEVTERSVTFTVSAG